MLIFRCVGCKKLKGKEKKETYAYVKLVGHDPVTGQPIHELLSKEDDHQCCPAQSTKWLNRVFLNRCYRAIAERPLARVSQIYDTVLESMKTEFFSQDPRDAERTKALQLEFVQNVRSYR